MGVDDIFRAQDRRANNAFAANPSHPYAPGNPAPFTRSPKRQAKADPDDPGFAPKIFTGEAEEADLEQLELLVGSRLAVGKMTIGIGAPKVGKTSLMVLTAISVITGLELTEEKIEKTGPALIICNEEDEAGLERMIYAACKAYGIDRRVLSGKLHIQSGDRHLTKIAVLEHRQVVRSPDADTIVPYILKCGIVYVGVDPFVTTYDGPENDNDTVDFATRQWARVAQKSRCALECLHHTPKPKDPEAYAGDLAAARGGGAIGAAVKIGYTLCIMGKTSGDYHKVAERDWNWYVRLDFAGGNYSPKVGNRPSWFHRESVYLNGHKHSVATLRPIALESPPAKDADADRMRMQEIENERVAQTVANSIDRVLAERKIDNAVAEMPIGMVAVSDVLKDVMTIFKLKETQARTAIAKAIPEAPGAREIIHNGHRIQMWCHRKTPAHVKSPVLISRQIIDD